MDRLQKIARTLRPSVRTPDALDRVEESVAALAREVAAAHDSVRSLTGRLAQARRAIADETVRAEADAADRAAIAALPQARLLSERIRLEGGAARRLAVRRHRVGAAVERPFSRWLGVTRCASEDPVIRGLWDHLLEAEAASGDVLRGAPNTVLDVPRATVSISSDDDLLVRLHDDSPGARAVRADTGAHDIAIPRFTYDFPGGKLGNFGHWLVDCLPHVLALAAVRPDARFLLPAPVRGFQRRLLSLAGLTDAQVLAWDGTPLDADRLLILESDGRIGGGRPLSSLLQLRERVAAPATAGAGHRRIYVSRRDAPSGRAWVSNERDVEALFRSRGFDVLVMSECPLDEQIRLFRDARLVAGISGAGLSDIVFSNAGIHVVVLLTDSLMRWYAKPGRGRAKWAGPAGAASTKLAAFGDSPRFYAHIAAACEQVSHSFLGGDRLPVDALGVFLDEVLAVASP